MLKEAVSLLSMNTWLTPTVLFLLLNLIIFTIAFTSRSSTKPPSNHHHHHHQPPQLQPQLSRSFSILQRFKSINFYHYTPAATTHAPPQSPPASTTTFTDPSPETHVEPPPVVVDHDHAGPTMEEIYSQIIQSKGNETVVSGSTSALQEHDDGLGELLLVEDAGPTMEEVYSRIILSKDKDIKSTSPNTPREQDMGPSMEEIYSRITQSKGKNATSTSSNPSREQDVRPVADIYNRIIQNKGKTITSPDILQAQDTGPTMEEIYSRIIQNKANNNNSTQYGRQNSDTKPVRGEVPVRLPRKMKKSASDKSTFNHFEAVAEISEVITPPPPAVAEEEELEFEVDVRADDFINRFKQQLKMQRMDSVQRYKEMIATVSAK